MSAISSTHAPAEAKERPGRVRLRPKAPTRRGTTPETTETTGTSCRRRVPTAVWVVGGVFVILLGAACLQVRLIAGQRELDRIDARIDVAQVRQDDLRQQEANLRSPAQVAQIATGELGMVQAAPPMLVNPTQRYIGSLHPQLAPSTTVPVTSPAEAASGPAASGN